MSIASILFTLLTLIMGIVDFMPSIAYLIQSIMSKGASKLPGIKMARRNSLDMFYIVAWISVGLLSLYISQPLSIFTLFIFLTFKSGSDLGVRVSYSIHDILLLRSKGESRWLTRLISTSIILAALPSVIFLTSWEIFQQIFTSLSAELLGIAVSELPYYLWISGTLFGVIFGAIRSRGESGVLLRGEFFLVMGSLML